MCPVETAVISHGVAIGSEAKDWKKLEIPPFKSASSCFQ